MTRVTATLRVLCLTLAACSSPEAVPRSSADARRIEDSLAQDLASRYDAKEFSDRSMPEDLLARVFTIDIERALLNLPRPIFVRVELADIKSEQGDTFALFESGIGVGVDVHWLLRVPTGLVDSLLGIDRSRFVTLGIVARIVGVNRPMMAVRAAEPGWDGGSPSVEPKVAEYFVARGDLVAFRVLDH